MVRGKRSGSGASQQGAPWTFAGGRRIRLDRSRRREVAA